MKYSATENHLRPLGRTTLKEGTRYLGYSYSGIEFETTAKRVAATLWTDGACGPETLKAWVAVFINDERVPSKRFSLDEEERSYVLYESQEVQCIKVRLVKFSEAAFAKVGIKAIEVEGNLEPIRPTQSRKRKIEFIGDSITCGYGNEGVCNVDDFTTRLENPWLGYAVQVADQLNAEVQLVSWSGIGVYSGWTDTDEPSRDLLMPELYHYTDLGLLEIVGEKERWSFTAFEPNAIIIHLGTNDASYTKGTPERVDQFGSAYYDFIKEVRQYNPRAEILCVLGVMGQELYTEIEKQVIRFREKEQDKQVTSLCLTLQSEIDGIGSDGHPSIKTHQKMAIEISKEIQKILKW